MKAYTVRRNLLWPFQALLSSAYANQPEFVERPVPTPADDELLVKVETFAAVSQGRDPVGSAANADGRTPPTRCTWTTLARPGRSLDATLSAPLSRLGREPRDTRPATRCAVWCTAASSPLLGVQPSTAS